MTKAIGNPTKLTALFNTFATLRDDSEAKPEDALKAKAAFMKAADPYIKATLQRAIRPFLSRKELPWSLEWKQERPDALQAARIVISDAIETKAIAEYSDTKNMVIGILRRAISQSNSKFWSLMDDKTKNTYRQMMQELFSAIGELTKLLGRKPTTGEIAGYMKLSVKKYKELVDSLSAYAPDQMSSIIRPDSYGEEETPCDYSSEQTVDIHDLAVERMKISAIKEVVYSLPEELLPVAKLILRGYKPQDICDELHLKSTDVYRMAGAIRRMALVRLYRKYKDLFSDEFATAAPSFIKMAGMDPEKTRLGK